MSEQTTNDRFMCPNGCTHKMESLDRQIAELKAEVERLNKQLEYLEIECRRWRGEANTDENLRSAQKFATIVHQLSNLSPIPLAQVYSAEYVEGWTDCVDLVQSTIERWAQKETPPRDERGS